MTQLPPEGTPKSPFQSPLRTTLKVDFFLTISAQTLLSMIKELRLNLLATGSQNPVRCAPSRVQARNMLDVDSEMLTLRRSFGTYCSV